MHLRFAGLTYQQVGYLMTKETLSMSHTYQCRADFLTGILFKNHSNALFYTQSPDKLFAKFI